MIDYVTASSFPFFSPQFGGSAFGTLVHSSTLYSREIKTLNPQQDLPDVSICNYRRHHPKNQTHCSEDISKTNPNVPLYMAWTLQSLFTLFQERSSCVMLQCIVPNDLTAKGGWKIALPLIFFQKCLHLSSPPMIKIKRLPVPSSQKHLQI